MRDIAPSKQGCRLGHLHGLHITPFPDLQTRVLNSGIPDLCQLQLQMPTLPHARRSAALPLALPHCTRTHLFGAPLLA